jgi:N-acetylglucosamine kinase-like BadF-type ATPase
MRHSVAVLADADGQILSSCRTPETLSVHTTPPPKLLDRFANLLREVFARADLRLDAIHESVVCAGLSGVTFPYDQIQVLPASLSSLATDALKLVCTGDAEVTFAAYAQSNTGSLILSHSGSTAYAVGLGRRGLEHFRYGGWGPTLGDEGSGFWIGREGLRAIGEEHDQRQPDSALWKEVRGWLEKPTPGSLAWEIASNNWLIQVERFRRSRVRKPDLDPRTLIYAFAHQSDVDDDDDIWRKTVAGIAIPVVAAARKGDRVALDIIARAVGHLSHQHAGVCKVAAEAGLTRFAPVVLYGGILNHNPEIRDELCGRLQQHLGANFDCLTNSDSRTMRPALGALLFALGDSTDDDLKLPSQDVIENVQTSHRKSEFFGDLIND